MGHVDSSVDRIVNWATFGAVLFDLDGVITPTATIHERAWAALFAPWGFTPDDYLRHVDGKPRYDGVRSFLASRGVELPWGDVTDEPGDETICALGNRKNVMFNEILARDGIEPYPGTLAVLAVLDAAAVPQAIVSSSKNAAKVLDAAAMTGRFAVIVDGVTAVHEQLAGKPDPAMFHLAAERLGVPRCRCIVVEDAESGVAAGAAGGFGFVLGIARGDNSKALVDAGADLVVADLADTLTSPADRADGVQA